MRQSPEVSVCLTTYNRSKSLPATLDSLLQQDLGDFELIVSDDHSADDTEAVSREYEAKDKRVKYFRNEQRLGMPGNLNQAIWRSSGALVANVHDCDIYRRDMLTKARQALRENEDAAFVFNQYESRGPHGEVILHAHDFPVRFEIRELTDRMLRSLTSPVWGTVMARRACYDRLGFFNPRFAFFSDVEMWMRLNLTYPVAFVPEPLMLLAPHESHHPHATITWSHEHILVAMHEEIIQRIHLKEPVEMARAMRRLRKMRDRRWLYQMCCLLKNGCRSSYFQGLRIFSLDASVMLKLASALGLMASPALLLRTNHGR